MNSLFTSHRDTLLSLGFAISGKIPKVSSDPEIAILDLLPSFFEDRKLFRLLLAWLHVTSELIHIERLNTLARKLEPRLKVIMATVALKLTQQDRRWNLIHESMKKSLPRIKANRIEIPEGYDNPFLLSKNGLDLEFARFGLRLAKLTPEDSKKILVLRGVLAANGWLRLRALIGSNFRADVAYLYVSERAKGPADAARVLSCSRDTAYRNWRSLEDADVRKLLKLSA